MTTLKDMLNDFADQLMKNYQQDPEYQADPKVIVEEYLQAITERLIGVDTGVYA